MPFRTAHITSGSGTWAHLAATVLPDYIRTTLWLCAGVGIGVSLLGEAIVLGARGFAANVPHYLTQVQYPQAAAELIRQIARRGGRDSARARAMFRACASRRASDRRGRR